MSELNQQRGLDNLPGLQIDCLGSYSNLIVLVVERLDGKVPPAFFQLREGVPGRDDVVQGEPGTRVKQTSFHGIGGNIDFRSVQVDGKADISKLCHHIAATDHEEDGRDENQRGEEGYKCFFHDCFLEVEAHSGLESIQGCDPFFLE